MGAAVSIIAGLLMSNDYMRRFTAAVASDTLLELNEGQGGGFWALLEELCACMGVDFRKVRVRLATRNYDVGPSVIEHEDVTFLVIPLGFFKLLEVDREAARAILAHELAHVCQGDTNLWLLSESYLTAIRKFLMPLAILTSFISLALCFGALSSISYYADSYEVAAIRRASLAGIIQSFGQPVLLLAFTYSVRKLRRRSEELADMAGVVFAGPSPLLRALAPYYTRGILSQESSIFSSHPNMRERTGRIRGYIKNDS
jgi:hypothetical protein